MRWGRRGASALPDRRSVSKHTRRGRGRGVRSRGGRRTGIAAPSAWLRVPAAKFAGRTSAVHPENYDPGEGREREREAGLTLVALPVAPRSPIPHWDTRAAATCVHSSPGLPFRSRGPELRAADASIPRRDAESPQPAGTGGDMSSGERTCARVRCGWPGEPLTSEKILGETGRGAGMRVVQVSPSARDAHDQPRPTRRPELGGSPWLEGGSERGAEGGGSRAGPKRDGKGRVPAARKGAEGVPPKPRPPRSGARRPAPPAALTPPSREMSR